MRERVLSAGLRQKHAVPLRAAGGNIVYVQDLVREAFIEHARLNREVELRSRQLRFQSPKRVQRQRARARASSASVTSASGRRQHGDREQDSPPADAQRRHGDDFAVRWTCGPGPAARRSGSPSGS